MTAPTPEEFERHLHEGPTMTVAEAVAELDELDGDDPESAHGDADQIILQMVPPEVRDAYDRAYRRIGFWYA